MHGVRTDNHEMFVVPAEAGIQRLKSLDPGQQHAGMAIKWDSTDYYPKLNLDSAVEHRISAVPQASGHGATGS